MGEDPFLEEDPNERGGEVVYTLHVRTSRVPDGPQVEDALEHYLDGGGLEEGDGGGRAGEVHENLTEELLLELC